MEGADHRGRPLCSGLDGRVQTAAHPRFASQVQRRHFAPGLLLQPQHPAHGQRRATDRFRLGTRRTRLDTSIPQLVGVVCAGRPPQSFGQRSFAAWCQA